MSPAQAQSLVDKWNRNHKPGTEVIRYKLINPNREPVKTKTRSVAWVMNGGIPMVMVDGIAGGVALEGVEVI